MNLEIPEGQVPLESPFYIERPPIESDCYDAIAQPNALIRIKAPRQMGKSSLMSRILNHGRQQGYQAAYLNFQLADSEFLSSLDRFLQWFCASVAEELDVEENLEKYWKGVLGSNRKCTKYFKKYLLSNLETPLVLGLDEVDRVFQHPEVAIDFLGLLRAWHEEGKNQPIWQKLRLVISHSKEVYIPLNINQSPFNVGIPIELPELNPTQVQELIERHGVNLGEGERDRIMELLGGHPYLVRVALYRIARENLALEDLLQIAPTEEGIYYNHLRRHLANVQQNEGLTAALQQVISSEEAIEIGSDEAFKLRSMGLVKFQGNAISPLCELYRLYFRERLGESERSKSNDSQDAALAAIVFTDVVDSTTKMVSNQKQMLDCLKRDFQVMQEICQQYHGQLLKNMGDGLLMYFSSAVKAVDCAREMQNVIAAKSTTLKDSEILEHRIGIHLGDVFMSQGDVLGAGVNIAARLQSKAKVGGICISQMVYDTVKDHLDLPVEDMGLQELKGVPYRVQLYQIKL
ncbi:MAG: hypothetical protein F6K03_09525 [Kamptonema sp. SIO4C4]|nr:hypothetical protein [Kamptonema sp. SIO4C4]